MGMTCHACKTAMIPVSRVQKSQGERVTYRCLKCESERSIFVAEKESD